jgi:hypothetical protein
LTWNKEPVRNLIKMASYLAPGRGGGQVMSRTRWLLAAGAALLSSLAHVTPVVARDYPWCAQGGELDYPGECAYQTYEQCLASVSGRLLYCGGNPRLGYGLPPQPQPRPRRHVRHPAPY